MECKRNCDTCTHCWKDESVNARECTCAEDMTEEESVKYFEDMSDNCPYYRSQEENDEVFLQALVDMDYFGLHH